jgi:hypothetical protein
MSLAGCVRLAMVAMDERAAAAAATAAVPSYLAAAMMVIAHCDARPNKFAFSPT